MKPLASPCGHAKPDGTPCRARKVHGSDFCFFHDPAKAAERAAAQQAGGRGGRAAALPPETPPRLVQTPGDVAALLSETINQVRTGLLDPRIGNCVGYLAGVILKAAEQGALADRLAALEGIVNGPKHSASVFDAQPDELMIEDVEAGGPRRASA